MITIHNIKTEQIDQLVSLFNEYRIFYGKKGDIPSAKLFLSERIKNKESVIYVALDESNKMVGFVNLYPLFSSVNMGRIWLLNDLFVDINSRGMGLSLIHISEPTRPY